MKKIISIMLVFVILTCSFAVFAEDAPSQDKMDYVTVKINIGDAGLVKRDIVKFELLRDDDYYLSDDSFFLESSNTTYTLSLAAGEIKKGDTYKLCLKEGLHSIAVGDNLIYSGGYTLIIAENDGSFEVSYNANVISETSINLYINNAHKKTANPLRTHGEAILAEISEFADALGLPQRCISYSEKNIIINYNNKKMTMNFSDNKVDLNGETLLAQTSCQIIDGLTYVPIKLIALVYADKIDISYTGYSYEVFINTSVKKNAYEQRVNNISSKTDYLIWINKSKFKVYVFLGKKGNWELIRTIPCSIGAPSTPTVTGEFEYQWREKRWQYNGYYVGPIMRFYRGYAIHTVLLKNDGTNYDGRTGKMISHGCIRIPKDEMNWLISYAPLYTKIYITEN